MSSPALFTPSLRYTNKDTCNSAWTFIDGQNVSDIEVPKFIKNLFTSFDDSRYGKMGKDLIEGAVGCDVSGVTQPTNGQFGTKCTGAAGTSISEGESCDLTCDTGYTPSNQPICSPDGNGALSSTTATCTDTNGCEGVNCGDGASCSDVAAPGTGYTCSCNTDFIGTTLTNQPATCVPNPCSNNPCQHGGTCSITDEQDGSYTCDCPTGYTGDNCEIEPSDPCSTNPCQHGGTCTSDGSSHTCVCPEGYTGDNCETEDQTTYKCSSAFEGAKTGKDQPCNLNYPASKGWTKGDLDADPLWAKYNTGKDDSSLTKDQSDAVKDLISTNSGKGPTYTPDQMDDEVWKKCCKKAECTDAGWGDISITGTGSWPAYGSSWGCIF